MRRHITNASRLKYPDLRRVVRDVGYPLRLARSIVHNAYVVVTKNVVDQNNLVD